MNEKGYVMYGAAKCLFSALYHTLGMLFIFMAIADL